MPLAMSVGARSTGLGPVPERDVDASAPGTHVSTGRRVVLFFALSYAISWAWVVPLAATGHTVVQGRGWPTHFPSLLGPLLAACILTAWTGHGAGVRDLLARMWRWRIGWRWWLGTVSPPCSSSCVLTWLLQPHRGQHPRSCGLARPVQPDRRHEGRRIEAGVALRGDLDVRRGAGTAAARVGAARAARRRPVGAGSAKRFRARDELTGRIDRSLCGRRCHDREIRARPGCVGG